MPSHLKVKNLDYRYGSCVDFEALGIPRKYFLILDALKTKPGFSPSQYPDLLAPINFEEWKKYWASRKSGKAPGLSGIIRDPDHT
mmetsp:Transcript_12168/g.16463  ORF Transcript_12168/g.16463 Transcript_12168/m.16463 type:complete len:85 (-) Transcript_12168:16-270(-)